MIPNFEILGRIGGGAYGEVFLGRSVTGMYRAVKVVRREDFEHARTFEREFEGIQRYEKVSQGHPGLVDVLHVGRDDAAGFYYYVMELADDESGEREEVDPGSYRPRTLSSDLRRGSVRSIRECVEVGASLARALGHLHHAGLTHRDVKPSNIIFVKGRARLADMGLVARSGQRTYVGTEGYVPPEGPGTAAADLYSLAMVLYEMHTGKDRLDFPELPTNLEIPPTVNRDEWRALNAVICRGGAPDPRKRYETGHTFAAALQRIVAEPEDRYKRRRPSAFAIAMTSVLVLFAAAAGGALWLWKDYRDFLTSNRESLASVPSADGAGAAPAGLDRESLELRPPEFPSAKAVAPEGEEAPEDPAGEDADTSAEPPAPAEPEEEEPETAPDAEESAPAVVPPADSEPGDDSDDAEAALIVAAPLEEQAPLARVKVMSQPSGATVWMDGEEIGVTETRLLEFDTGPVEIVLRLPGYHDYVHTGELHDGAQVVEVRLAQDLGPLPGQAWVNSLGLEFVPQGGDSYMTAADISPRVFEQFLDETGLEIPLVGFQGAAQVRDGEVLWEFADWMTRRDRATGHLGPYRYHRPVRPSEAGQRDSFRLALSGEFGALIVNSEPTGARVLRDGTFLGRTPVTVQRMRMGPFRLRLELPGYEPAFIDGEIEDTELRPLDPVALARDGSATPDEPWTNSQGMRMRPAAGLLAAVYPVRVRDFREFVTAVGTLSPPNPGFAQTLEDPVAGVSRAQAEAFCEWLTERERAMNLIRGRQRYRLPTDREWSLLAGYVEDSGATPEERFQAAPERFLWGEEWPPPLGAGNFADGAAADSPGRFIESYEDGFPRTSPVGIFAEGPYGLYDLAGNVWEWVGDAFSDRDPGLGVVRGGGWNSHERETLSLGYRNALPVHSAEGFIGFRYVLAEDG